MRIKRSVTGIVMIAMTAGLFTTTLVVTPDFFHDMRSHAAAPTNVTVASTITSGVTPTVFYDM
jgi:hypothetical protein